MRLAWSWQPGCAALVALRSAQRPSSLVLAASPGKLRFVNCGSRCEPQQPGGSWQQPGNGCELFMCSQNLGIKKGRTDVRPEGRWLVSCARALFFFDFLVNFLDE